MTNFELHDLTSTLLLSCTLAFGGVACGAQNAEPASTSGSVAAAEPLAEAGAEAEAEPEPAAPTYSFEVASRREFVDETVPPPTDDSAWPPTELAVPIPEGVRPLSVSVRTARHTLEMETALSASEVQAFYQAAFEALGYTLRELDGMPNETRFGAERGGELTEISVAITSAGNDLFKVTYAGPRMPAAAAGGETASEEACRAAITAAGDINIRQVSSGGFDSLPEAMRAGITAEREAEVALCAGHWRAPHLACYERYANEPSMLSQCTEVARRDSGQDPLPS